MQDKDVPLKFPIEYVPIEDKVNNNQAISPIAESQGNMSTNEVDIARNRTSLNVMDAHGRLSFLDTNR